MILVVEDEAIARRALLQVLTLNGYEATGVGSAEEALGLVADGAIPDMALVDIDLPGMNGVELVSHLIRRFPSLRPIYMTSHARESLPLASVKNPTDYLRKPLNISLLLELMANTAVA